MEGAYGHSGGQGHLWARASTTEYVNALYGLQQFRVRGVLKVTSVALLMAITHNLMRWASLTA
jgi:IS5 family transposase